MQNKIILKQVNYFCKNIPECASNIAYQNGVFILLKGPPNSLYEGGEYVLQLTLKSEYPFSPPSIKMLTPNGRFETGQDICTSFSNFHPNTWSPAINFNIIALSIVSFMLDTDRNHVGALKDGSDRNIKILANASKEYNKKYLSYIKWMI